MALAICGLFCGAFLAGCPNNRDKPPTTPKPPEQRVECVRSGCSGTVCVRKGEEVFTTCEFRPEYACYEEAICEQQRTGECGWTETDAFRECLRNVDETY